MGTHKLALLGMATLLVLGCATASPTSPGVREAPQPTTGEPSSEAPTAGGQPSSQAPIVGGEPSPQVPGSTIQTGPGSYDEQTHPKDSSRQSPRRTTRAVDLWEVLDEEETVLLSTGTDCPTACKALGSMRRAAEGICDGAAANDDRCSRAKKRVGDAADRVHTRCGACPNPSNFDSGK